jgi:tetratricopeptide (TPR) repeat protein
MSQAIDVIPELHPVADVEATACDDETIHGDAVADEQVDEQVLALHRLFSEGEDLGAEGQHAEAADRFRSAREVARALGDAMSAAHADDRIAAALWEIGRLRDAETHLRAALAVHDSGSDSERSSWARFRLGWLLAVDPSTEARRQEALELLGAARSTAADNEDRHRVASCDEKAAWVLAARGDLSDAISVLHKSVAVFDAIGADADCRVARANLAVQLIAAGMLDDAEFQLREAWSSGRKAGDSDPGVATRLARLLADSGRPEEALAVLDEAATAIERAGRSEQAAHHLARARACNVAQLRVAAREAAEEALSCLRGALLPGLHAEALEHLARCAEADAVAVDGDEAAALRDRARALLGESISLYLVADQPADARRLAADLVPRPPSADDEAAEGPVLTTGVYL